MHWSRIFWKMWILMKFCWCVFFFLFCKLIFVITFTHKGIIFFFWLDVNGVEGGIGFHFYLKGTEPKKLGTYTFLFLTRCKCEWSGGRNKPSSGIKDTIRILMNFEVDGAIFPFLPWPFAIIGHLFLRKTWKERNGGVRLTRDAADKRQ